LNDTVTLPAAPVTADLDHHALNAMLNLYDANGKIQFGMDTEAARRYFLDDVNRKMRYFHDQDERLAALLEEGYYEQELFDLYDIEFIKNLTKRAFAAKYRFATYMGAMKFYGAYAMKTFDGKSYLERFEDRVVMTALMLGNGDTKLARNLVDEMISGRFQPATPTFQNSGKKQRGELVSCFLLRAEDDLESIFDRVTGAAQLSKRGGGVAISLTNIREHGAPIKQIEGQSSGIVPWMKILEDTFSAVNQLGQRQGAGAVYLSAHHPDIMTFLDTKRENADEKIRIKTLSLGVVIPDITFELSARGEDMYLFSPYDVKKVYGVALSDISITEKYEEMVADPRISKKKISARKFFETLSELQFESGYPYIVFEDTVNRANPIDGRINMSNLCSEILQVNKPTTYNADGSIAEIGKDISCNLGSLNIAAAMDGGDLGKTVEIAVRGLTAVSDLSDIVSVPTVASGNRLSHAIGLGAMNLHGYLAREGVMYGSKEGIDFTNMYFYTVLFHALRTSAKLAVEKNEVFDGYEKSKYATGEFFTKYTSKEWAPATKRVARLFSVAGIEIPTQDDWKRLAAKVAKTGIYNQNLQAVPPTGSISYINNSTASIHPIIDKVETRKEGKTGRVYVPAPYLTNDNIEFYEDAYSIGPDKIIDTYAAATQHIDQGLSLTLFFKDDATTKTINKARIRAWRAGIKTIYYVRVRQLALGGTEMAECVSCQL
jgi:ribonucleoside-diphosphate reductase alpha chain